MVVGSFLVAQYNLNAGSHFAANRDENNTERTDLRFRTGDKNGNHQAATAGRICG